MLIESFYKFWNSNYSKLYENFENLKNTNIVHHEKIHNIAFVTNIKSLFIFWIETWVKFDTSISQLWMNWDEQAWFLFLIFD
jgi:hypothetical protein